MRAFWGWVSIIVGVLGMLALAVFLEHGLGVPGWTVFLATVAFFVLVNVLVRRRSRPPVAPERDRVPVPKGPSSPAVRRQGELGPNELAWIKRRQHDPFE